MKKLVHVAVGVIFDCDTDCDKASAKILIAKRADHQYQGGLWEFPGGKVETGESAKVALQRELEEELGLQSSIDDMHPLITIPFHYPAANKAIIDALLLPKQIAISQDNTRPDIILNQVANTLKNHTNIWIQLRAPSLDQMQYTQLAMKLYGICHEAGSKLIWNCPLDWYQIAFADGLHLSNRNFNAVIVNEKERLIPVNQWLSAACHNLPELEAVQGLADYVLVSPVHETKTHPRANALTWSGFKVITDQARIPCYALGGMDISEFEHCIQSGGQGIAGIRGFLIEEKI